MHEIEIDFYSVLIAAFLQWLLAFYWYSPWFFYHKKSVMSVYKKPSFHISAILIGVVLAIMIRIIESFFNVMTTTDGMLIGALLALGIITPTKISSIFRYGSTWKTFVHDTCFWFVSVVVMAGFLAI